MKKLMVIMILMCLMGCTKSEIDYTKYIQLNEEFTINDVSMKTTEILINPLDNLGLKDELVITINFEYLSSGYIESKNCMLIDEDKNELEYYTIDGLDYLKLSPKTPYIRFKVDKQMNNFILNITYGQEVKSIFINVSEKE